MTGVKYEHRHLAGLAGGSVTQLSPTIREQARGPNRFPSADRQFTLWETKVSLTLAFQAPHECRPVYSRRRYVGLGEGASVGVALVGVVKLFGFEPPRYLEGG